MAEGKSVTKAIADFTKGVAEIRDSYMDASENFMTSMINSRKEDIKKTYSSEYKPVNETKTVNLNVKVEGDSNTAKMDKDQITNAVLKGLQDPNLSNELSYTIDGGSAPSAATGKKN